MPPPYRTEWLDEAQADVRRLDRPTALRLFDGILPYARTGGGHVAPLHGDMAGSFRLRLGDYRVLFTHQENTIRIFGVRHRSQAYRSPPVPPSLAVPLSLPINALSV